MKTLKASARLLLTLVLAAFCGGLLLASCGGAPLADGFDEQKTTSRAKELVGVINSYDYEAAASCVREDLRSQLTAEALSSAWDANLRALGAFQKFESVAASGIKDQKTGEDYAMTISVCSYENGLAVFTLTFDRDLSCVGMYMK